MLTLRSGPNAIVVVPETGASLLGWTRAGTPILRRARSEAVVNADPHAMGWFPLVPYANRIGQAAFRWHGRLHRLTRNFGDQPHTIHGIGWQRAWTVEVVAADSVTLSLTHAPDASWPFAFAAVITYSLMPDAVSVTMAITNTDPGAAPAGLGLHPFFPKSSDPLLRFNAGGAWDNGADALPCCYRPVPVEWDHTRARPVVASRLDNCFTGWDRRAVILAGPGSLSVEASAVFGNLQVFTPSWADFFCVEPVTHIPDAINRPDLPAEQAMHVLAPGETLTGTIRLTCAEG